MVCWYTEISRLSAPSLISRVGMCGKKSFPQKKQSRMKSSISLSGSTLKLGSTAVFPMSRMRYSLSTEMCTSW